MSYKLADGSLSTDYEVGDTFVYNDPKGENNGTFRNGSVVKLLTNDGSDCPLFSLYIGECLIQVGRDDDNNPTAYAAWDKLTKHSKTLSVEKQDPEVVIKQSDYDSLVDEINMLRELVAELTAVKEEQQFKPISEMTLEDWQQALEEGWKFSTHYMGDVTVYDVDSQPADLIPILVENAVGNTWYIGIDGTDIDSEGWTVVQRVK
jgi:hypothetical protein